MPWAGLWLSDGVGGGGERSTAQRRSAEERLLACQQSGERRELSGTPVRRMNKVHLFIPSSAVRCHSLKTGLSKNTAHFFLPASDSPRPLCFTHTHTDEEKVMQDAFKSKYTVNSIMEFIPSTEGHQASPRGGASMQISNIQGRAEKL